MHSVYPRRKSWRRIVAMSIAMSVAMSVTMSAFMDYVGLVKAVTG